MYSHPAAPVNGRLLRFSIPVTMLLVAGLAVDPGATGATMDAQTVLRTHAGFAPRDLARIAAGEVVARTLDAEADEVAIGAAVRIDIPAAFYVQRFRAIETFKQEDVVLQVRRFGHAPSAADLAPLQLAEDDLNDLEACRSGDCRVKLDAPGIARIRSIDRSHPASGQQISDAFKEHLATYAAGYLQGGNPQLIEYRDEEQPRSLFGGLKRILSCSPYLKAGMPTLAAAVGGYDGALPTGVDGFLYWSHEVVGPRPVISITHSLITDAQNGVTAIASKQIYASHFFTASLGVTLLIETAGATSPETLVVYINRSRLDMFEGFLGGAKRSIVRSRARSASARMMRALKTRLEGEFRHSTGP